jgi:hypothetical protein
MTVQRYKLAAAGALLALLTAIPAANAQNAVKAGMLSCEVSGGAGFVIGSSKSMGCTFTHENGDVEEYAGRINKFGLDIGVTEKAVMSWAVLAPTNNLGAGALTGSYVGASAEGSVGVGGGANVLVGGSDHTISLQPLSVQGQTGINAAVGVAELVLDAI